MVAANQCRDPVPAEVECDGDDDKEFNTRKMVDGCFLFDEVVCADDVIQGALGDCYLLSAMRGM